MKKIVIALSLVLCFQCLYGCSSIDLNKSKPSTNKSSNTQANISGLDQPIITAEKGTINVMEKNVLEQKSTDLNIQTPPDSCSYSFNSINELYSTISKRSSFISDDSNDYGALFYKTVSALENNEIVLDVPMINGDMFPLRGKENYSNITLLTSELYNIPWIWYHCNINDSDIDIKIAYPSVIKNNKLDSAKTYYEVLKLIAPNAPNPDNYTEFESYQNVYEAEIKLENDKAVIAMFSEFKDSNKVYAMFKYDNILVSIHTDNDNLSEEFWSNFSIANY